MDLIHTLQLKNIKITEIRRWAPYFRKRWEDTFAFHLTKAEQNKIYMHSDRWSCGYLWHLFSYEKKAHFREAQADQAFNDVLKSECYVFYQHYDDILIVHNASALSAEDFAHEEDIYIVDKDFTWTYVVSHAVDYCKSYFAEK